MPCRNVASILFCLAFMATSTVNMPTHSGKHSQLVLCRDGVYICAFGMGEGYQKGWVILQCGFGRSLPSSTGLVIQGSMALHLVVDVPQVLHARCGCEVFQTLAAGAIGSGFALLFKNSNLCCRTPQQQLIPMLLVCCQFMHSVGCMLTWPRHTASMG